MVIFTAPNSHHIMSPPLTQYPPTFEFSVPSTPIEFSLCFPETLGSWACPGEWPTYLGSHH